MRMTVAHIYTREIYEKWGRGEWLGYSYYNLQDKLHPDYGDIVSGYKDHLRNLIRLKRIVRVKKCEHTKSQPDPLNRRVEGGDRFRLTGKAMYELKQIIENNDIELTEQDYADMAIAKLVDQ